MNVAIPVTYKLPSFFAKTPVDAVPTVNEVEIETLSEREIVGVDPLPVPPSISI